jgi:glutathione S-transferase
MLKVFTFPPVWGLPTPSAYGLKIEAWLRMSAIEYEAVHIQQPMSSPKGTVPWIEHEGVLLADSTFIVEYLNKTFGDALNQGLSPAELATGHAVARMLEETLGRIIAYTRWLVDANWPMMRETAFGHMQEPAKSEVGEKSRARIREIMESHGIGRHSADEVQQLGLRDLRAVEDLLADKDYLLDDQPHGVDATVFGVLAEFIVPPLECEISDYARSSKTLSAYCDRILGRYFPEYH